MSKKEEKERERQALGKKVITLLEGIDDILKQEPNKINADKLEKLWKEIEKTANEFGRRTYPLWRDI